MATLIHYNDYPCVFDLNLIRWERYEADGVKDSDTEVAVTGEPYTMWIEYRMILRAGDSILFESEKDTTLILEDIKQLIYELRQMVKGEKNKMAFDPMEPDFGLVIRNLTESEASVRISSAAGIRAEILPHVVNQSTDPSNLLNVMVWIDFQNQRSNCYGGYGPGLYFYVLARDIERFVDELQAELDALGPYVMGK